MVAVPPGPDRGTDGATRVAAVSDRFAALVVPNYRRYFAGQGVSVAGNWMQSVALAALVLGLTGSGSQLGLITAAQFVPVLLLGPFAGVVAGQVDRRRMLLVTQTGMAITSAAIGVLVWHGSIQVWMVYALSVVSGVLNAFDNPTRQTFIYELVGPSYVTNAVALNVIVMNVARAVGPALAGVLIATVGIGQCFVLNALTFVAADAALLWVRRSELLPGTPVPRRPGQLRAGFHYVWHEPVLRTTLVMLTVIGMFVYEFQISIPLLATDGFGLGPRGYGLMSSLMGVGAVVGGLLGATSAAATPARLVRASLGLGLGVVALAASPWLGWALLVLPVVGAMSISYITLANATLQLHSSDEMRSRVMALYSVSFLGTTPIGAPIIGTVADHFGARLAIGLGGAAAVTVTLWGRRTLGAARTAPAVQR